MLPHKLLEERLRNATRAVLPDANLDSILVRPCPNPKFGDYQSSSLISLAKDRKLDPRNLATAVATKLKHDLPIWFRQMEIAGAGFLNFFLDELTVGEVFRIAAQGDHLFFERTDHPRCCIIDFSSPNVAKPMHVGHIRSTILGDCLARTLRFLGHRVIADNHIGDWGTTFGKLIVGWKQDLDGGALAADPIGEMERLYKTVNAACESDPSVLERARQELVKLQNGDAENLRIWRQMIDLSQHQFDSIYARLGVKFDCALGESFYNPELKGVVRELSEAGIARESQGALAVFFDDPQLGEHPALIQKTDGAANYTTTDLATLAYRMETWKPDEIIYVTDGRQQLHFNQLFAIFRRWRPQAKVKLAHIWFGSILGENGKPFKTRAGDTIKLADLLDEAEERALAIVTEKNPGLSETQRREIARVVGLGAIKYADLLPNRQSDYVFSWEKMLSFHGNTAPYLQYAYARTRSIFRKAELQSPAVLSLEASATGFPLNAPEEVTLAKHLLNFGLVLEAVADEFRPNYLCNYLYDLAGLFARFYEACPVLNAEEPVRRTRLVLCDLTGRVLRNGLEVLGIETLEQM